LPACLENDLHTHFDNSLTENLFGLYTRTTIRFDTNVRAGSSLHGLPLPNKAYRIKNKTAAVKVNLSLKKSYTELNGVLTLICFSKSALSISSISC
jgi:hypothetical protein